jgi:ADP-sugar diphosphatase
VHRRRIDEELHTCMSQLEFLRTGVNLRENQGFTMLGEPYKNTKIGECEYHVSVCGHDIRVCADQSMVSVGDKKFEMIFAMKAFVEWLTNFDREFFKHCTFGTILVQSIDFFGPAVGFLKFKTDIKYKSNNSPAPGIVFMRGAAVAMLVVLQCESEYYALTTVQPRVPIGKYSYCEIPAGMVDNSSDFVGAAAKEMKEETGIAVNVSDLVDMSDVTGYGKKGFYPSVGGCDEYLRFYLYTARVTRTGLNQLNQKLTGVVEEGEQIALRIVKLNELPSVSPDMKTFTALYLYGRIQDMKRENPELADSMRSRNVDLTPYDFSGDVVFNAQVLDELKPIWFLVSKLVFHVDKSTNVLIIPILRILCKFMDSLML